MTGKLYLLNDRILKTRDMVNGLESHLQMYVKEQGGFVDLLQIEHKFKCIFKLYDFESDSFYESQVAYLRTTEGPFFTVEYSLINKFSKDDCENWNSFYARNLNENASLFYNMIQVLKALEEYEDFYGMGKPISWNDDL